MANLKGFKAVITAGGIGTRLLPFSKEIPKEMAPIFSNSKVPTVKPIIQAIFEQLYNCQIRDFFVVVGREKRAIEDHFTPDQGFVQLLARRKKKPSELISFYEKIRSSNLVFVNQPEPLGFGDAVLRASPYVSGDFLVHAGDTYVISKNAAFIQRLKSAHYDNQADATVLLQDVRDPKQYGVVLGKKYDKMIEIRKAIEKPKKFVSKTAIMPVYIFKESIFSALRSVKKESKGELQLTDAIQHLISEGKKVIGVKLSSKDVRLDIGSPQTLIDALRLSGRLLNED